MIYINDTNDKIYNFNNLKYFLNRYKKEYELDMELSEVLQYLLDRGNFFNTKRINEEILFEELNND